MVSGTFQFPSGPNGTVPDTIPFHHSVGPVLGDFGRSTAVRLRGAGRYDAEIEVDVLRAGRRAATVAARMRSGDGEVLALLGTFADQVPGGPSQIVGEPPELPPIDECVLAIPPVESGFHHRVRTSVRPVDAGFRDGHPSGSPEVQGWFELPDDQPIDAFGLLMAADAFAPVVFNSGKFPVGWSPTLELTVHVRGIRAPGPLRCRFFSKFVENGMFDESGELWDSRGTLVAHSRQLALIPRA